MTAVQLAGIALAALLSEKLYFSQLSGNWVPDPGVPGSLGRLAHRIQPDGGDGSDRTGSLGGEPAVEALCPELFPNAGLRPDRSLWWWPACGIFCGPASRSCPGGWMKTCPLSPPTARLWARRCSLPSGATARAERSYTPFWRSRSHSGDDVLRRSAAGGQLDQLPRCFQGLPINLITAGLMALSLVGFYGLHLS